MMKNIAKLFLLTLLLMIKVNASDIVKFGSIISNIEIYKSSKVANIKDLDNKLFESYKGPISIGLTNSEVWIKMRFYNKSNRDINSLVVFNSSHIDSIRVYKRDKNSYNLNSNLSKTRKEIGTLFPYFSLKLKANESKEYYVNIKSSQIPSSFSVKLEDNNSFLLRDRNRQFVDIFITGLLMVISIYFMVLYFNSKKSSYLYFSMFVMVGVWYLFSYSGLAQIYASNTFLLLDKSLSIIKLNTMVILSSFYVIKFFDLSKNSFLYKLYLFIIISSIVEIIVAGFLNYSYYFALLVLALYSVINIVTGLRAYICGLKEAALYTLGAIVLAFGVYLNIFNALNVNIFNINSSKSLLIFALAVSIFVLTYGYRYYLKRRDEFNNFITNFDKKLIIDRKVKEKQEALKKIESSHRELKDNMNIIIKNNLQTTLSMLRLQESKIDNSEVLAQLKSLESRLLSIVKTYSLFLSAKNPNFIVMKDYLNRVIKDTLNSYGKDKKIDIDLDVDAVLGLEDAISVGLSVVDFIINRLDSNNSSDAILISLKNRESDYQFAIKDIKN